MKKAVFFFLLIIGAGADKAMAQIDWATFHGCEKRCGIYPVKEYQHFGELKWKFKTGGKIFSSPAIYEGVAYVGSEDGHIYAVDVANGQQKWKFRTGGAVHSSPAYYKGVVYFGSFDGYYYALDAESGREIWRFETGGEQWMGGKGYWGMKPVDQYLSDPWDFYLSSPVVDKNEADLKIYFGSSDGHLYALDAKSGRLEWKFKTDGIIHSSPSLYNGKVYIGSWDSKMYALDAQTGKEVWSFQTGTQMGMNGIQASPALDGGLVFFGARDGNFYALDAETGDLEWKYFADNSWILSTAAVKDGVVYFGTSDSYLFLALDAQSGKEKFRFKTNGYLYSSPALVGNTAYFGDFTGKLFAVDLEKGNSSDSFELEGRKLNDSKVLSTEGNMDFMSLAQGMDMSLHANNLAVMDQLYSLGSILSSPALGEGVIYFGSADGYLYALNLEGEKRIKAAAIQHSHH